MKKGLRLLSFVLVLALCFGILPLTAITPVAAAAVNTDAIGKENKEMRLWYDEPAPDDDGRAWKYSGGRNSGWETRALALGNSYLGAKVFGLTERENTIQRKLSFHLGRHPELGYHQFHRGIPSFRSHLCGRYGLRARPYS